jgi:hypothetical protein
LMVYPAQYAWLVDFDGPRCTNVYFLFVHVYFCFLYSYSIGCNSLQYILWKLFIFPLFSWFNKLVVSKARVGVCGLSVSSPHYAPFGNNRTEVNQTLLKFYFWIPAKLIRTVVVYWWFW